MKNTYYAKGSYLYCTVDDKALSNSPRGNKHRHNPIAYLAGVKPILTTTNTNISDSDKEAYPIFNQYLVDNAPEQGKFKIKRTP